MPRAVSFLLGWLITTLAVLVATKLVPGIHYDTRTDLLVATLLLVFLNSFVRPVMLVISLPLMIFTLGLFTFVINALLLMAVSYMIKGFVVEGFKAAFWGGLVISLTTLILNSVTGTGKSRVSFERKRNSPPPPRDDDGPVIDV